MRDATANILVPLRDGRTLKITGHASIGDLGAVGGEVGFSLRKLARRLARGKAFRAVMKVVKSPVLAAVLPPQVTLAIKGAEVAAKLIGRAKKGDRGAKRKLAAAARGSETAREAVRLAAAGTGTTIRIRGGASAPTEPEQAEAPEV